MAPALHAQARGPSTVGSRTPHARSTLGSRKPFSSTPQSRCRRTQRQGSVITNSARPAEAVRLEKPLTKQEFVDFLRAGCRPQSKWRCALLLSLSLRHQGIAVHACPCAAVSWMHGAVNARHMLWSRMLRPCMCCAFKLPEPIKRLRLDLISLCAKTVTVAAQPIIHHLASTCYASLAHHLRRIISWLPAGMP